MNNQDAVLHAALRQLPAALTARGLTPHICEWLVTQRDNRRYLFGVVDVNSAIREHGSIKPYAAPSLLHDMSTLLKGRPVVLSNTTGLRYCVPLTDPPRLPNTAPLPESAPRDGLLIGVGAQGAITAPPKIFLNALVAGAQGSGKSNFLKTLAVTAGRHGWRLYLADAESHTFAPESWGPLAVAPVAETPEAFMALIAAIAAELNRRSNLYQAVARDGLMPADLAEYNREAARAGGEPLPYLLLLADEANSFFDKPGMAEALAEIARRGRKWGLVMVLAAHSWRAKDVPRTLSGLLPTRVCFRVADDTSGAVALNSKVWGKKAMDFTQPGRGLLLLNGQRQPFQAYCLSEQQERAWLRAGRAGERPAPVLNELEKRALSAARAHHDLLTLKVLMDAGLSEREAERMQMKFFARGWAKKDRNNNNAWTLTGDAPRVETK